MIGNHVTNLNVWVTIRLQSNLQLSFKVLFKMVHPSLTDFGLFSNNIKSKDRKNIAGDLQAIGKFIIHLKLTAWNSDP